MKLLRTLPIIIEIQMASGKFLLPLMYIGKSQKPRALKNIAPNALPVY
jgi:hypothetical protein